ncbi:MAG: alpha/beta hydrolase [Desulfofustis sp.]|nr:alpha/beta hydrolase [Desulfofustis sp.]
MTAPFQTSLRLDHPQICSALFFPRHELRSAPPPEAYDLEVTSADGLASIGCRIHVSGDSAAPIIVFFHGNGETVGDYDEIGSFFTGVGLTIVFATYRGYGWSSGEPTVTAMLQDSNVVFDAVLQWCAEHSCTGPLLVMGRSLGSVSAIDLAYRRSDAIKALIIESGFADSLPLLESLGCPCRDLGITEAECFNNRGKIATIELPTLILHGSRDQIIPVAEAEVLQAESGARNKQFQVVPGADHNSLLAVAGSLYFAVIKRFVDGVTGANTWRQRRKRFKQEGQGQDSNGK